MKYYIITAVAILFMSGCNNPNKQPDPSMDSSPMMTGFPASSNNSETAISELDDSQDERKINYYGTYEGTLPAADAEGIETKLTLNDDHTYVIHTTYLGKGENAYEEHGRYYVNGDLITLQGDDTEKYYRIHDSYLMQLDNEKKDITGSLAKHYQLTKK